MLSLFRVCPCMMLIAACCCCSAYAQSRYRPPGGSPLPRQLDYFRRDVGVLDPYNTFVAPRRQLDRSLQQMQVRQQQEEQRTSQSLSQIRQSSAAATGTGATFMNYSHFYSTNATAPIRASANGATSTRIRSSYGSNFASNYAASNYAATNYGASNYGASSFGVSSSTTRSYSTPSYRANSYSTGGIRAGNYGW